MQRCCAVWGRTFQELPEKYTLDFAVLRHHVITALAEVKDRPGWDSQSMDRAGGYMISALKIAIGLMLCELAQKPFLLIVLLSDGIFWTRIARQRVSDWPLEWFDGNNIPRRNGDREPVFMIPMSEFRRLKEGE